MSRFEFSLRKLVLPPLTPQTIFKTMTNELSKNINEIGEIDIQISSKWGEKASSQPSVRELIKKTKPAT